MQRLLVDSGPLVALFDGGDRWHDTVTEFIKGYRGALLALAERTRVDRVLTLDKRDFDVYRLKNGKPLRNVLQMATRR